MDYNMDYQSLFNGAAGFILILLGWLSRELWNAVTTQRADLSKLREELPKTYITRDDFKDAVQDLRALLVIIDAKLDRKMDKGG